MLDTPMCLTFAINILVAMGTVTWQIPQFSSAITGLTMHRKRIHTHIFTFSGIYIWYICSYLDNRFHDLMEIYDIIESLHPRSDKFTQNGSISVEIQQKSDICLTIGRTTNTVHDIRINSVLSRKWCEAINLNPTLTLTNSNHNPRLPTNNTKWVMW